MICSAVDDEVELVFPFGFQTVQDCYGTSIKAAGCTGAGVINFHRWETLHLDASKMGCSPVSPSPGLKGMLQKMEVKRWALARHLLSRARGREREQGKTQQHVK